MKRLHLYSLAFIIMIAVTRSLWAADHVTTSLYTDPSGWVINTMDKMDDLPKYSEWKSNHNDSDSPLRPVYATIEGMGFWRLYLYCNANQSNEWWRFEIDFAPDDVLSLSKEGVLYITAEVKGKPVEFRSSEITFADRGLKNLMQLPQDIHGGNQSLDRGTNGIKMYVRIPGTAMVDVDEVLSMRPANISLFNQTSSR